VPHDASIRAIASAEGLTSTAVEMMPQPTTKPQLTHTGVMS
jgi:hypothetical protein